jgi:hypothetical protein
VPFATRLFFERNCLPEQHFPGGQNSTEFWPLGLRIFPPAPTPGPINPPF